MSICVSIALISLNLSVGMTHYFLLLWWCVGTTATFTLHCTHAVFSINVFALQMNVFMYAHLHSYLSRACFVELHSSPIFSAHTYTLYPKRLSLKDSVRVMTSQKVQEIVFPARHQNDSCFCAFVCARALTVDWKQTLCVPHSMTWPSVILLQPAEIAEKAVNPQKSHEWHIYPGLPHLNRCKVV